MFQYKKSFLSTKLLWLLCLSFIFLPQLQAENSVFREKFILFYNQGKLKQQARLITKNKTTIPYEVNQIVDDVIHKAKNYKEKMLLLKLARSIASMHKDWNNGDVRLLKRIEALQSQLRSREEIKKNRFKKLTKAEKIIGNFVLGGDSKILEKKNLPAVVFPHWLHRIWFECKVCHDSLVSAEKGGNGLKHKLMSQEQQCGACHNGRISFPSEAKENCDKCHIAGTGKEEHLIDFQQADQQYLKSVAEGVGSIWRPENLPEGKLPIDQWGFIRWLELDRLNVREPLLSISSKPREKDQKVRNNEIYYELLRPTMDHVIFSHTIHSKRINCSTCHDSLFSKKLGEIRIRKIQMSKGNFCGRCHNRVSFTYADCHRCHNASTRGEKEKDVLYIRRK